MPIAHLRQNKDEKSKDFMHQSIPPAPSTPGLFARLLSPGGGAFANFALPGGRVFATPGPLVSFSHSRSFLSEYNYTEALTEKKKQNRLAHLSRKEKIEEGCKGMFSILCQY